MRRLMICVIRYQIHKFYKSKSLKDTSWPIRSLAKLGLSTSQNKSKVPKITTMIQNINIKKMIKFSNLHSFVLLSTPFDPNKSFISSFLVNKNKTSMKFTSVYMNSNRVGIQTSKSKSRPILIFFFLIVLFFISSAPAYTKMQ